MFDYDVVIIGGGPAGLAAGLYLSRARRKTLLLEKESFGGPVKNVEWIENYPGFPEGIAGAQLASQMVAQATKYGLKLEQGEVGGIELFSSCRVVTCLGGKSYTTSVIIVAGGCRQKKMGVPGEEELQGKGIFHCAFCDGGEYSDRIVAVCGGGDTGLTDALYMTKYATKVYLVEAMPALTASAILQERATANPKMEILCGQKVDAVIGTGKVEGLELTDTASSRKQTLKVDGVLVHVGLDPNTEYLKDIIPLDNGGQIIVDEKMTTENPCIFAAGDIRSGSPRQVSTAVGDGATAAIRAERTLQEST
ncbi:MAG: FAD-dependent oxidoreductase [Dehalococcoidales bacterium]|nr:FAD-dependent oxidoreductase [Dehalococcoidales bacterium]